MPNQDSSEKQETNKPLTPNKNSDWNNYVYEKDIKTLEYFHTDVAGDCDIFPTITTSNCVYYGGEYHLNGDSSKTYLSAIQFYDSLTVEEYVDYVETEYAENLQKGDYFTDDFYFIGQNIISWYSDNKVIAIAFPGDISDSGDLVEDLIGIHTNEYPSGLKFEPVPNPVQ